MRFILNIQPLNFLLFWVQTASWPLRDASIIASIEGFRGGFLSHPAAPLRHWRFCPKCHIFCRTSANQRNHFAHFIWLKLFHAMIIRGSSSFFPACRSASSLHHQTNILKVIKDFMEDHHQIFIKTGDMQYSYIASTASIATLSTHRCAQDIIKNNEWKM